MHWAGVGNNLGALALLIESNCKVDVPDSEGNYVLDLITSEANQIAFFQAGFTTIRKTGKLSIKNCSADFMKKNLLPQVADIDWANSTVGDMHPLVWMYDAAEDVIAVVKPILFALVDAGKLDVNANCPSSGKTALSFLAYQGSNPGDRHNVSLAQLLAELKPDPNKRKSDGATPLYEAIRGHNQDGVEQLLKYPGIALNRIVMGETELTYAIESGRTAMVSLLLAAGVDRALPNTGGELPKTLAEAYGLGSLFETAAA